MGVIQSRKINAGRRIHNGALIVEACIFCGALDFRHCEHHDGEDQKMMFMEPHIVANLRKAELQRLTAEIERVKTDIDILENLAKGDSYGKVVGE